MKLQTDTWERHSVGFLDDPLALIFVEIIWILDTKIWLCWFDLEKFIICDLNKVYRKMLIMLIFHMKNILPYKQLFKKTLFHVNSCNKLCRLEVDFFYNDASFQVCITQTCMLYIQYYIMVE